jgi:hypothetical protein
MWITAGLDKITDLFTLFLRDDQAHNLEKLGALQQIYELGFVGISIPVSQWMLDSFHCEFVGDLES